MLFRAILSLLSIPEGIAAEDMADALKKSIGSWRGGGSRGSMRSMCSDQGLATNRWGSFRSRGLDVQTGQRAGEPAGTSAEGACSSGTAWWLLSSSASFLEVVNPGVSLSESSKQRTAQACRLIAVVFTRTNVSQEATRPQIPVQSAGLREGQGGDWTTSFGCAAASCAVCREMESSMYPCSWSARYGIPHARFAVRARKRSLNFFPGRLGAPRSLCVF